MKISKLELISLLLAIAFGAFAAGWFLRGASSAQPVRVETADLLAQNTALVLSDPVPSAGGAETESALTESASPEAVPTAAGGLVNLNTASKEELMTLPGIGEQRAEDIIADRESNGPFRIPEDLTRVSGIGEGILEGLIDLVTVS